MIKYLFIFIGFTTFAQTLNENHELLWEISGNGLEKNSYLFGSLHSNDKRLFDLTDSTYFALHNSDAVILEADVFSLFETLDTRRQEVFLKYDNQGEPYTADSKSTETVYGNEDGAPQFLDAYFQQYCYNTDKKFFALESVQSQVDLFSDIQTPQFSQLKLESFLTRKEDMIDLYIEGDIYGLDELLKMSLSVYPDLYKEMIIDRNFQMLAKMDSLIQIQPSFCAVGAGHLAGPTGLINLLRSKGYSVRKVMASYDDRSISEKLAVRKAKYYDYDYDSLGVHIRFPGKPIEVTSNYEDYNVKLIYRDLGQGNSYEVEIYPRRFDIGLADIAATYIASPAESPYEKMALDNGGEAYQGLSDSYPLGLFWTRVIMSEYSFVVVKAYGGNKFMNSPRAFRFFDQVWFD